MQQEANLTNGSAAAAILAAAIGSTALGLFIILSEAISSFKNALNLYNPVGPLSGKTLFAIIVWLAAWLILHISWKDKQVNFGSVYTASVFLIIIGLIGTFPPFYDLFTK